MKRSTKRRLKQLVEDQKQTNQLLESLQASAFLTRVCEPCNQLGGQLLSAQQHTMTALDALLTATGDQGSSAHEALLGDIQARLEELTIAQRRANDLFELALRAGFENEEQAPGR